VHVFSISITKVGLKLPAWVTKVISNKWSIWASKPKMDSSRLKIGFRLPIRKTHFGLSEKHNPNMSILPPGNSFAEKILFWILLLEKMLNGF
jgi:hypothetical protein